MLFFSFTIIIIIIFPLGDGVVSVGGEIRSNQSSIICFEPGKGRILTRFAILLDSFHLHDFLMK